MGQRTSLIGSSVQGRDAAGELGDERCRWLARLAVIGGGDPVGQLECHSCSLSHRGGDSLLPNPGIVDEECLEGTHSSDARSAAGFHQPG